jgi:hypothetical protein
MEMLLRDFIFKVHMDDIFEQTIVNDSLHKINNDNGISAVD